MFLGNSNIATIIRNRGFHFFSLYISIQIAQSIISLMLLPIITRLLPPGQMGIYATCLTFSLVFNILYFVGITEAVYFKLIQKDPNSPMIVSSILLFEIFMILAGIMAAPFLYFLIGNRTIFNIPFFPYIFFTFLYSLLFSLLSTYNMFLQATNRLKKYTYLNFIIFLLVYMLAIYLLVKYELGAMSFIYSYLVVYFLVGIYIIIKLFSDFGFSFDKKLLLSSIVFSGPLIPHNMAHWVRGNIDKIFLTSLISPAHTGLYQVALFFGNFFNVAMEGFRLINNPRFFGMFSPNISNEKKIVSILPVSVGAFSIIGLFISLFSYEIVYYLFDKSYHNSYIFIPIILSALLFYLIYLNVVNVLFYFSKTKTIAIISSCVALIHILLCYFLIKRIDIWGACVSLLISNMFFGVSIYYFGRKMNPLRWPIILSCMFCTIPMSSYFSFSFFNTLSSKTVAFLSLSLFVVFLTKNYIRDAIS